MVLVSGTGQAASQPARDVAAARALFEEGVAAADAGDFPRAADRFERSYALRPSAVVGYNLASALSRTGRLVEAAGYLRRILYDRQAQQDS